MQNTQEPKLLRVISHLKNGDVFTPDKIVSAEITKNIIETLGLRSMIKRPRHIKEEV